MIDLYHSVSKECSKLVTNRYSTSFSMGIRLFDKVFRAPIYSIYGFVRFADEIVDSFHGFDKKKLLEEFKLDTFKAIESGISLNPILHAFQKVVKDYSIDKELITAFLDSMEMDLYNKNYDQTEYEKYIYGSAEVVGLMCLKVFTKGNEQEYLRLRDPARSLGSAFQKINFLRDIKSDYEERGRVYFPNVDFNDFSKTEKEAIEQDIRIDFEDGLAGIKKLPKGARKGVYLAYVYYTNLFKKICNCSAKNVSEKRIRVRNRKKLYLLATSSIKNRLDLI